MKKYNAENKKKYSFQEMIEEGGVFKKATSKGGGRLFITKTGLSIYKKDNSIELMDSSWEEDTFEKVGESFDLVYKELE